MRLTWQLFKHIASVRAYRTGKDTGIVCYLADGQDQSILVVVENSHFQLELADFLKSLGYAKSRVASSHEIENTNTVLVMSNFHPITGDRIFPAVFDQNTDLCKRVLLSDSQREIYFLPSINGVMQTAVAKRQIWHYLCRNILHK